jgi:hypothetical protein
MSEVICAVPCLCNKAWGMSGVICVFFPRFYVITFEVCQECVMLNTLDIPQASLHKHRIAQITSDIPETSLHKHGTIT